MVKKIIIGIILIFSLGCRMVVEDEDDINIECTPRQTSFIIDNENIATEIPFTIQLKTENIGIDLDEVEIVYSGKKEKYESDDLSVFLSTTNNISSYTYLISTGVLSEAVAKENLDIKFNFKFKSYSGVEKIIPSIVKIIYIKEVVPEVMSIELSESVDRVDVTKELDKFFYESPKFSFTLGESTSTVELNKIIIEYPDEALDTFDITNKNLYFYNDGDIKSLTLDEAITEEVLNLLEEKGRVKIEATFEFKNSTLTRTLKHQFELKLNTLEEKLSVLFLETIDKVEIIKDLGQYDYEDPKFSFTLEESITDVKLTEINIAYLGEELETINITNKNLYFYNNGDTKSVTLDEAITEEVLNLLEEKGKIRIEATFKFENENLNQELKHQFDLELTEKEVNNES